MMKIRNRLGNARAVIVGVSAVAAMATGTAVYLPQQDAASQPVAKKADFAEGSHQVGGSAAMAPPPAAAMVSDKPSRSLAAEVPASANNEQAASDVVRVYYATDRATYDPRSAAAWMPIVGPTLFGLGFICVLLVRIHYRGAKPLRVIALVGVAVLTVYISHGSLIEAQQTLRLAQQGNKFFGSRRYESQDNYPLNLGFSDVSLPKTHQKGEVERPSLLRLEFTENEKRHVMLKNISELSETEFFEDVRQGIDASRSQSTFVFIHGYNVQFDDGLMRTAQIAKDLQFEGVPIFYSWPSHAKLALYTFDEAVVSWTVAHLDRFLTDICERTGARQIHVVAHSMGNRAMLGALERIQLRRSSDKQATPLFEQVVMAAPDVDVAELNNRYTESLTKVARHVTLYASADDGALKVSASIHGFVRAGLSGPHLKQLKGIEAIDVSPVDTSLLGHSYYGSSPLLIRDIRTIVQLGKPASLREWLTAEEHGGNRLWRFRPEIANAPSAPVH
jgi:esterase/lipase superfamily enzyme